jgi:hypothetical protein
LSATPFAAWPPSVTALERSIETILLPRPKAALLALALGSAGICVALIDCMEFADALSSAAE